jgi:predicted GTPase
VSADGWIDDWYSKVGISAITQADKLAMEKAAQVWKAKEEAEAKSKAEATRKKTTITCTRGKIVKKITAINPKCPKGYKKR